jgi:hypothetical protein
MLVALPCRRTSKQSLTLVEQADSVESPYLVGLGYLASYLWLRTSVCRPSISPGVCQVGVRLGLLLLDSPRPWQGPEP